MIDGPTNLIYLDNAATSFPKPPEVLDAMRDFTERIGANPGRSGHRLSIEAGRALLDAREAIAGLIGAVDPFDVALTKNATEALNLAILGAIEPGGHIVTTSMEHNSVARPLRYLESRGGSLTIVEADAKTGAVEAEQIAAALRAQTAAVVMTHASNVTGTIMPIAAVGEACRERGVLLIVDAAQTGGSLPIDVEAMGVDLLALTGHKSMYGPQGTGALYVRRGVSVRPLAFGGTGSSSESDVQPDFMPDRLESGTPNTVGFAGLTAGLRFVNETSVEAIRRREVELVAALMGGLADVPGVRLLGSADASERVPIVSVTLESVACDQAARALDEEYGILVRVGLHCAPWAHRTLGTLPSGAVRFSCGYWNTADQIRRVIDAVAEIVTARAGVSPDAQRRGRE